MRKGFTGKFEMSSGLFKMLEQPDTYWVFEGLLRTIEEAASENYEDTREEHEPLGMYCIDGRKASELLSRRWVDLFDDYLYHSYKEIRAVYTGTYNPKEYNFGGDRGDFIVTCSPKMYDKICKGVLKDPKFADWLYETYKSYDGFISFYPSTVQDYIACLNGIEHGKEWKYNNPMEGYTKALVIALSFCLFRKDADMFSAEFSAMIENTDFESCLYFEPETLWYDDEDLPKDTKCRDCGAGLDVMGRWTSVGNGQWICRCCADHKAE